MNEEYNDEEITQKSKYEARQDMKMFCNTGWKLKSETRIKYVLTRNNQKFGIHIGIFIIMSWLTGTMLMEDPNMSAGAMLFLMFLGNVIYYFANRKTKTIMK